MGKTQRVPKMRDMFDYLVVEAASKKDQELELDKAIAHLGITGRILEVNGKQNSPHISDDTKSMLFIQNSIAKALPCPICGGLLDPKKSVSYDHIKPKRDGGSGHIDNVQMAHPYCNTGYKESGGN